MTRAPRRAEEDSRCRRSVEHRLPSCRSYRCFCGLVTTGPRPGDPITILSKTPYCPGTPTPPTCPSFGNAGQYEVLTGLADGVLDPRDPLNAIIQDIELGKDRDGKVRYTATFQLVKPVDMSKASGLMWQDVPNRGGRITIVDIEKGFGDVGLSSGWQGDNSGSPTGLGTLQTGTTNEWVKVPVARHHDGSSVTGEVIARHREPEAGSEGPQWCGGLRGPRP